MIVMINGAFGAGKTTMAGKIVQAVPNCMLYDPEEVGFMLRSIIPESFKLPGERTGDFQDLELWPVFVVQVAQGLVEKYKCNLVVPMTLKNKQYFQYIRQGFTRIDANTLHFCLMASKECIHNRLIARGEIPGSWAFTKTEACLEAFQDEMFHDRIDTETMSVDEILQYILKEMQSIDVLQSVCGGLGK